MTHTVSLLLFAQTYSPFFYYDQRCLMLGSSADVTLLFGVSFPLVYDTSSRETFEKLEEWLNEVEMYSTKKDIIKMLVGNKIDKVNLLRLVVL